MQEIFVSILNGPIMIFIIKILIWSEAIYEVFIKRLVLEILIRPTSVDRGLRIKHLTFIWIVKEEYTSLVRFTPPPSTYNLHFPSREFFPEGCSKCRTVKYYSSDYTVGMVDIQGVFHIIFLQACCFRNYCIRKYVYPVRDALQNILFFHK